MTVIGRLTPNWSLVRSLTVMYGSAVIGGAVQYGALIVLARALGPHDLGVVVLTTSIGSFTAAAVELGIVPVLVRFRPAVEKDDPELWAAIVRAMSRLVLLTASGITALALALASVTTVLSVSGVVTRSIILGLVVAVPTVALTFFQGYLQSERRFHDIAVLSIGSAIARLILIVLLAVTNEISVLTVVTVYVVTACGAAGAAWSVTMHRVSLPVVAQTARRRARALVAPYLRWTMVGRASVALNGRFDIFLLSILSGAGTTGVYGAASQSATPFPMLATAVGEVSFPHFSARSRAADARGIIGRWAPWLPVLMIASTAAAIIGAFLLPSILGPRFERSSAPFAVLVAAYGLQIWLQPIAMLLYASDRQRHAASIAIAQTLMVAALDVALIPRYGALGPALAILTTTVVTAPLIVIAAIRRGPGYGGNADLQLTAGT